MLILAGVSINAVVGDNGVLTRTQYASFLNEMAAVEEAVQLWKTSETIEAKGEETKAIPANGLCKTNELEATERLVGEVGYYRVWSLSETQPSTDILSSASEFNSDFGGELIFYPAGVQDLYYLNNEALDIKGNKTYLIDASTGMIYSMAGISLKGVRCYSSNMAKAVMNGDSTAPLFAEAEVSGSGSGEALAGNTEAEYGFQIIADAKNDNIYKLYNNGDLYGKGKKGIGLNSTGEELQQIKSYQYDEFTIPGEIVGQDNDMKYQEAISKGLEIVSGYEAMYVLYQGKLWAWGNNTNNKFGLSKEEQIDYTGRYAINLSIKDENNVEQDVIKVFPTDNCTFVLANSSNPTLYAAGFNQDSGAYLLGLGVTGNPDAFSKVPFENASKIVKINENTSDQKAMVIVTNDSKIFASRKCWCYC